MAELRELPVWAGKVSADKASDGDAPEEMPSGGRDRRRRPRTRLRTFTLLLLALLLIAGGALAGYLVTSLG